MVSEIKLSRELRFELRDEGREGKHRKKRRVKEGFGFGRETRNGQLQSLVIHILVIGPPSSFITFMAPKFVNRNSFGPYIFATCTVVKNADQSNYIQKSKEE